MIHPIPKLNHFFSLMIDRLILSDVTETGEENFPQAYPFQVIQMYKAVCLACLAFH